MLHPRKDLEIYGKLLSAEITESHKDACAGISGGQSVLIAAPGNTGDRFTGKVGAVIERGGEMIPVLVPESEYGGDICFECNMLYALGGLIKDTDILYPKFEKTGGAVMFTEKDGQRKYLLIKNESGHIGFPKGHIDYGETETDTAKREVYEETGLELVPLGDFRCEYTYLTREKTVKTGVFFIGHYDYREPEIQEDEILDDWLLTYDEALKKLNFPEDRELLTKAEKYISERIK